MGDAVLERSGPDREGVIWTKTCWKEVASGLFWGPAGGAGGVVPGRGRPHRTACVREPGARTVWSQVRRAPFAHGHFLQTRGPATHPSGRGGAGGLPRGLRTPPLEHRAPGCGALPCSAPQSPGAGPARGRAPRRACAVRAPAARKRKRRRRGCRPRAHGRPGRARSRLQRGGPAASLRSGQTRG